MAKEPALKSCPFCGGRAVITKKAVFMKHGKRFRVECTYRMTTCPMNMRTHHYDRLFNAVKAWNTRSKNNG